MFTRWIPDARLIRDSARVENRGPWMTSTVAPSTSSGHASSASRRAREPNGSANGRWRTVDPSKYESARPCVRSTSWSATAMVPIGRSGSSDPTAAVEMSTRTPMDASAQTIARAGIRSAAPGDRPPCRGRKTASLPPIVPRVRVTLRTASQRRMR